MLKNIRDTYMIGILSICLAGGCDRMPQKATSGPVHPVSAQSQRDTAGARSGANTADQEQSKYKIQGQPVPSNGVVAYLNSQPIRWEQLKTPLIEAHGRDVLADLILQQMVARRLADRGQTLTSNEIEAEKKLLIRSLDDDPDQAQRLLTAMRQERRLGEVRFHRLLTRQAGLRMLIQDDVEVAEAAIQEAYQLEYGPKWVARVIFCDSLTLAADLARRARAGESFSDLAVTHSTDPSAPQGGLLPPISPADATYPVVVREVVAQLQPRQISDPIILENGYAVLKLQRKIPGQSIQLEEVHERLVQKVRQQVESMLMQRMARTLMAEADVIVLDPTLKKSWDRSANTVGR